MIELVYHSLDRRIRVRTVDKVGNAELYEFQEVADVEHGYVALDDVTRSVREFIADQDDVRLIDEDELQTATVADREHPKPHTHTEYYSDDRPENTVEQVSDRTAKKAFAGSDVEYPNADKIDVGGMKGYPEKGTFYVKVYAFYVTEKEIETSRGTVTRDETDVECNVHKLTYPNTGK